MSEISSPPADNPERTDRFIADIRLIIGDQAANAYQHLFDLRLLSHDIDGRLVEAGASTTR
jgi:hypothetical protein